MARVPEGPPPAPVVQRLRLRYAKRGRLRFASHRDFARAFERALRRAEVPVAHSAGFSPHPRVSYANAAPTGVASEAEYLEVGLTRQCDPEWVRVVLDAALPDGLDVLAAVEAAPGALADALQASSWRVRLPGVPVQDAEAAVDRLLAAEVVEVSRMTKNGLRTFDARAAVHRASVEIDAAGREAAGEPPCAILQLVVRHATPAVRPDDVLDALRRVADLTPPAPPEVTRLAQGPLDEVAGTVADPLHVVGAPPAGNVVDA